MDSHINLNINGHARTVSKNIKVAQLIEQLDLHGKRLAIEVNGEIVPRSEHAEHVLKEHDKVEIIHAVGGG